MRPTQLQISYAYVALLRHPHDKWRNENQHVYAILRDLLADMMGDSDYAVQNWHETIANVEPGRSVPLPSESVVPPISDSAKAANLYRPDSSLDGYET